MFENDKAGLAYDYALRLPKGVGVVFFQVRDPDGEPYLIFEELRPEGYTRPTRKLARTLFGRAILATGALIAAKNRARAEGYEIVGA